MKRVSVYAKYICIKDGPVLHFRPGEESKNLIPNVPNSLDYQYKLSTYNMVPKEKISFMAAGNVCVHTLTQDESGEFYDLGETVTTDKLISLVVRQFLTGNINSLDKKPTFNGFVKVDLEF